MNQYLLNLFNQSGGRKNFGYILDDERTSEQKQLNLNLFSSMPEFKLSGNGYWKQGQRSPIYDCVKKLHGGKLLRPFYQQVGSCVGHGAAKTIWYIMCVEQVMNGDREAVVIPYEPYLYGIGRYVGGIGGNGDGSFGSAQAEACKKYGVLDSRLSIIPPYSNSIKAPYKEESDCITFSGNADREFGYRKPDDKYMSEGIKHLIKTTAVLKSEDDVVAALSNGYLITCASDWGGYMEVPIKGTNHPVRLSKRVDSWAHQQMISDYFDHPELGMIYHIDNSWGPNAHGHPPIENDSPIGGYWIGPADLKYMLAQREVIVYSNFDGFPEQKIADALLKVF